MPVYPFDPWENRRSMGAPIGADQDPTSGPKSVKQFSTLNQFMDGVPLRRRNTNLYSNLKVQSGYLGRNRQEKQRISEALARRCAAREAR
jgi:hypothetical protein